MSLPKDQQEQHTCPAVTGDGTQRHWAAGWYIRSLNAMIADILFSDEPPTPNEELDSIQLPPDVARGSYHPGAF